MTYSGFLGTDDATDLDNVSFALGTDYTQFDPVGTYNTTIALGTAADDNYNFTPLNTSTFQVGKANPKSYSRCSGHHLWWSSSGSQCDLQRIPGNR